MAIETQPGGGPFSDSIVVHLAADPADMERKAVRRHKRPYKTLCGSLATLPPTVTVRDSLNVEDGKPESFLVTKPRENYHGICRCCALATPMPVRNVMPA